MRTCRCSTCPADPPSPEIPALDVLQGAYGPPLAADGPAFLSQLLFHSAAISASKRVPSTGYRYALRVNPSSGNLHPTEFHFLTRGLKQWPDGLYHYRPSSHMAEQRAIGDLGMKPANGLAPITFFLTSIAWREAWKYRERAYRYCLLDMGMPGKRSHTRPRAVGCDSFAIGHFPDDEVARVLPPEFGRVADAHCGTAWQVDSNVRVRRPRAGLVRRARERTLQREDLLRADRRDSRRHEAQDYPCVERNLRHQSGAHGIRRDQTASPSGIAAPLWRSCTDATIGARFPWRDRIHISCAALGCSRRDGPAVFRGFR